MSTATIDAPAPEYTPAERAFIDALTDDYERMYPDLTRGNKASRIRRHRAFRERVEAGTWEPRFSHWRHGGSYVDNIIYPSGAVGCIASAAHTRSGRFEIECAPAGHTETYKTRDAAARAEAQMALAAWDAALAAAEREARA